MIYTGMGVSQYTLAMDHLPLPPGSLLIIEIKLITLLQNKQDAGSNKIVTKYKREQIYEGHDTKLPRDCKAIHDDKKIVGV